MIEIRNVSKIDLEFVQKIDYTVPGCRLSKNNKDIVSTFGPDECMCVMAYEPGHYFVVQPKQDQDKFMSWEEMNEDNTGNKETSS